MQESGRFTYLPRKTILHLEEMGKSFFTWRDEFEVGHEDMDATHREFVSCVDALLGAANDELPARLAALAEHMKRHFAEEDEAMRRGAYNAGGCHVQEHAAVLKSLEEVQAALCEGRAAVVRAFAEALALWFPEHARVMDLGLARWLAQQRLGGAPILIRRRAGAGAHRAVGAQ
jgi:hemerythrin